MDIFWEKEGWEGTDKQLLQLEAAPFRRRFPFIPELPGLYIIRGPRQVGKSSWLKSILSHHTKLKNHCFYLSCEEVGSFKELGEILSLNGLRKIILLDEVSFIAGVGESS